MKRILSSIEALYQRLRSRTDSEHEQAIYRVALVGLITAFFWFVSACLDPIGENDSLLLAGLIGFFLLAIAIFLAICVWPSSNIPRRILGMLADAGGTTFALSLTGDKGVWLIGVYLFITFGNGFRY